MSISERINPDNLNIHQFQETPEGRLHLPFDVDRDLGANSKSELLKEIEHCKKSRPTDLCRYVSACKILWPEEPINLSETDKKAIKNSFTQPEQMVGFSEKHTKAALALPELHNKFAPETLMHWDREAQLWAKNEEYFEFIQEYFNLKIINPKGNYSLTSEQVEGVKTELLRYEQVGSLDKWVKFSQIAAALKILAAEDAINISPEVWSRLREEVKNEPLSTKYEMAVYMKILAAHKVEITAPGVMDIQMYPPGNINQSTPPIPETRKF
jgi:hypothetical protein